MERDYVLGTHEEEVERLGLQHRVWRPHVLRCWGKAGITVGKRILDIGAGPGYATLDLAEIVGSAGEVVAVERSHNFIHALRERMTRNGLTNVKAHEIDLMVDSLPAGRYDFSWCRWVAAFVSDPGMLIQKLSEVLPAGAVSIFHEYGQYDTWRYCPPLPHHRNFRDLVVQTWRESGGEPDAGLVLVPLLRERGFRIKSAQPLMFCARPTDYMWQWAAEFIDNYLPRLQEAGRIDEAFAKQLRAELAQTEADSDSLMVTPMVLEIIAEKI
ncbi:MAG TPA: methyltransferase domain-containing protein [Chthoniobacterales bacterium]|jgi:SAM-dependent methyltransferase